MLSNRTYDFLKAFGMVVAPSAVTVYLALSPIHHLDYTISVISAFSAVSAIVGVYLILSSKTYYESDRPYVGDMVVTRDEEGRTIFQLQVQDINLDEIADLKRITFRVVPEAA